MPPRIEPHPASNESRHRPKQPKQQRGSPRSIASLSSILIQTMASSTSESALPLPPNDEIPQPPAINFVAGFLLVGLAWDLTTPFIRRAAKTHKPPPHPLLESEAVRGSWLKSRLYGAFFAVVDLLRNPRYAVPLLLNLTGSVWFFLLIGKAGECFVLPDPCIRGTH